jgi:hypothetical protein
MSTEQHKAGQTAGEPPVHQDVAFEPADVNTGTIVSFLLYLALAVVAAFIISIFIFRYTTKVAVESETPPPPVRETAGPTMPPEPRLQGVPGHETDPQKDLRNKRAADEEANRKLEWVDQKAAIARIPVEEAMKIIVSKGLPAVPASPAEKKK